MSPLDARIASIGSPPFRSHLGSAFFATLSFGLFSSATTASKILWEQESATLTQFVELGIRGRVTWKGRAPLICGVARVKPASLQLLCLQGLLHGICQRVELLGSKHFQQLWRFGMCRFSWRCQRRLGWRRSRFRWLRW